MPPVIMLVGRRFPTPAGWVGTVVDGALVFLGLAGYILLLLLAFAIVSQLV